MPALVGLPFAATFGFTRAIAASVRNADGAIVSKPVNVPRYDHDVGGVRAGLMVSRGSQYGRNDAVAVVAGDWELPGPATVLTEVRIGGVVKRRAVYTRSPRATVNGCLNSEGHHRITGAVAGFLPNLGGFVRYRGSDWALGDLLVTGAGAHLANSRGSPLIESA